MRSPKIERVLAFYQGQAPCFQSPQSPLGATGARLLTTLVHALARTGGRYGLLTMCEGGGQANVTIIERV
jgi:hypothetical protein